MHAGHRISQHKFNQMMDAITSGLMDEVRLLYLFAYCSVIDVVTFV